MSRYGRNMEGFSLAEVIVGLLIFSIGSLAVAKMQVTAIQTNAAAKLRSQAVFLAEQRMEELLNADYGTLSDGSEENLPHTLHWEVTELGDFRKILVTVDWRYQGDRSISFHSIRGDLR